GLILPDLLVDELSKVYQKFDGVRLDALLKPQDWVGDVDHGELPLLLQLPEVPPEGGAELPLQVLGALRGHDDHPLLAVFYPLADELGGEDGLAGTRRPRDGVDGPSVEPPVHQVVEAGDPRRDLLV